MFSNCFSKLIALTLTLIVSQSATQVNAWGRTGHYIIGEATYALMTTDMQDQVSNLTQLRESFNGSLGTASVWADIIKFTKGYAWTRTLHYYDNEDSDPPTKCNFHMPEPRDKKNLIYAIANFTEQFRDPLQQNERRFHFLMNLHLLEDLHQPLHLAGKGRGGLDYDIPLPPPSSRKVSLHEYWDIHAVNSVVRQFNGNVTRVIEKIVKDTRRAPRKTACTQRDIQRWAKDAENDNCQFVWPADGNFGPKYYEMTPRETYRMLRLAASRAACYLTDMLQEK